jgi:hypothetical protein
LLQEEDDVGFFLFPHPIRELSRTRCL